jgi:hypothetical protein
MEKKTLNAKQLFTIAECRVLRRQLLADMENREGSTFYKYDRKLGRKVYDDKAALAATKAMEKIFALTYVPPIKY